MVTSRVIGAGSSGYYLGSQSVSQSSRGDQTLEKKEEKRGEGRAPGMQPAPTDGLRQRNDESTHC